jgi:acyl transferase domain-containing protein
MFIGLDKGHFLSPTGQCKPFDASADGYSRSEGCGLFVLNAFRTLWDENDKILGVIRGVEINQSGTASSITRPDVESQQALFQRLMAKAGVDPAAVSVIEAHGTGTQVGDVCEMESIRRVFGSASRNAEKNPLHVTSVKANIGHLEAASGCSGLAKLLLMFQHGVIPPLISLKEVNPLIGPLETDGIVLNQEIGTWTLSDRGREIQSRMAVLNNFGAAGSNAALLLEEYRSLSGSKEVDLQEGEMSFILAFSGKTTEAVEELRAQHLHFLDSPEHNISRLSHIAYSATARRQIYGCRLAVSGSDRYQLMEKLKKAPIIRTPSTPTAQVVFLFTGQGSIQYPGMGSQLYKTCPLFKNHIDECQSILMSLGFRGILDIITAQDCDGRLDEVEKFEAYQTAIFSLEYGLSRLWISWGVEPVAVVGHRCGFCFLLLPQPMTCTGFTALENMLHLSLLAFSLSEARLLWSQVELG